ETQRGRALAPGLEAKGHRVEAAQQDVRALETRRDALKAQIADMTRGEAPVGDSAVRSEGLDLMDRLPNISADEASHLTSLFDDPARAWGLQNGRDPAEFYADPTGFNLHGARLLEENGNLPPGSLAQMAEREPYVDLRFKEPDILKRLQREGLEPRKAELGKEAPLAAAEARAAREVARRDPANPTTISARTLADGTDLSGLVEFGPVAVPQWFERALRVVKGDTEEMRSWLTWYEEAHDIMLAMTGGDAAFTERLMSGFIASQANASPAGGINSVLQVMWKQARGE